MTPTDNEFYFKYAPIASIIVFINENNIIMNIGTTSIDSLPLSPQSGENIRMETRENNVQIANPAQALQQERDNDPAIMQKNLNQFVTGIQQASAAGLTNLPSRDIPQNQQHISQDMQIKPNFLPPPENTSQLDYIREHQSNADIIRAQAQKQVKRDTFEIIFEEAQIPFMLGIVYFLFQLPIVQIQLCKILPSLYSKDGNPNLSGYIFTSAVFAGSYYFLMKSMHFLDK